MHCRRYIAHRQSREDQVWTWLTSNHHGVAATMDIVRALYVNTPEERIWMARENVEKILRKLEKENRCFAWLR